MAAYMEQTDQLQDLWLKYEELATRNRDEIEAAFQSDASGFELLTYF